MFGFEMLSALQYFVWRGIRFACSKKLHREDAGGNVLILLHA
jgi:hypothetical protein